MFVNCYNLWFLVRQSQNKDFRLPLPPPLKRGNLGPSTKTHTHSKADPCSFGISTIKRYNTKKEALKVQKEWFFIATVASNRNSLPRS